MNILLTSVGRRSHLVRAFRTALRGDGRVLAANSLPGTTGMVAADAAFVLPPSDAPDYPDRLETLCGRERVDLLLSCHDLDTLMVSRHRDRLAAVGTDAVVPTPDWAATCLDKHRMAAVLAAVDLPVPWHTLDEAEALEAVRTGRVALPLLVKPRHGFGSVGVLTCEEPGELPWLVRRVRREIQRSPLARFIGEPPSEQVMIQERLVGDETCLGLVHDLDGIPSGAFACRVDLMRAGESDQATSVAVDCLGDLPRRLSDLTRHRGIWGVDLIGRPGAWRIIDVNPRFTGDYAFHHLAGADVPSALVAWRRAERPDPAWLATRPGVVGCKDLVPVCVEGREAAGEAT